MIALCRKSIGKPSNYSLITNWLDKENLEYQLLSYPNDAHSIRIPFVEGQGSIWIDFDPPNSKFVKFVAIISDVMDPDEWLTIADEIIPLDFSVIANKIKDYI